MGLLLLLTVAVYVVAPWMLEIAGQLTGKSIVVRSLGTVFLWRLVTSSTFLLAGSYGLFQGRGQNNKPLLWALLSWALALSIWLFVYLPFVNGYIFSQAALLGFIGIVLLLQLLLWGVFKR